MARPLRALIVEDVEEDAALVVRELGRGGFDVTFERVDTPEAMAAALARQAWDVIISDYSMPRFSAPRALALVKESSFDLPFVIVSETVGEDAAVEAMRAGAHDFMPKGRFARLVPAVERELREAALRAEQKQLREQLLISDRMASVGTLAAGVGHEINNPLAALMANLDFAAHDVARLARDVRAQTSWTDGREAEGDAAEWIATRLREIEEPLQDARESADRVRQIVRDLKIFSRSDEEKRGPVDVRRVLESSLRMAWNEIRHRARLVKDFGEVPAVEGNEARLGQVFLNLVVNAAQAMPEGRADRNEIRVVTRRGDEDRVIVEVRDTGSGIPESVLPRIFEPFFTTKPIGEGTGLGLAICHRIVTALGGQIAVESRVGSGTVFRVSFPAAKGAEEVPRPPLAVTFARRGKILVVDDELLLGTAIRRMLAAEHEVLAVRSGRQAIGLVSRGERFDAILCDLLMPETTGMDLHAELLRLAPDQAERVIFMTGGAFTRRAREFLGQVRNPRIEKPFEMDSIRALIHGLLR
jgi:signal transduction histidine kinase